MAELGYETSAYVISITIGVNQERSSGITHFTSTIWLLNILYRKLPKVGPASTHYSLRQHMTVGTSYISHRTKVSEIEARVLCYCFEMRVNHAQNMR